MESSQSAFLNLVGQLFTTDAHSPLQPSAFHDISSALGAKGHRGLVIFFFLDGYLLEALHAAITGVNCCITNGADVATRRNRVVLCMPSVKR